MAVISFILLTMLCIIYSSYKLPFVNLPQPIILENDRSALDNVSFVEYELEYLIQLKIHSKWPMVKLLNLD